MCVGGVHLLQTSTRSTLLQEQCLSGAKKEKMDYTVLETVEEAVKMLQSSHQPCEWCRCSKAVCALSLIHI